MASQPYFRSRGLSPRAARAEALLYRYPEISEQELADLIRTFANLPLLDFGLFAADQRLGAKLDAFYADHGEKLRPSLPLTWSMIALIVAIGGAAAIYGAFG